MKSALVAVVLLLSTLPLSAVTMWTESGARLDETIADTTTAAPAGALQPLLTEVPFSNFRYPHVDADRNVTFIADDPAYGAEVSRHGIYRSVAATGEIEALLLAGTTVVPGTKTALTWFRGLQMDGRDFVVNATDKEKKRGLYHWSNGKLRLIARSGTTKVRGVEGAFTNIEYGALSQGRVFYYAQTDTEKLLVLHDLASDSAQVLCRTGDAIPNRDGEKFRYFSPQNWIDGGNIVFRGASVANPHGRPERTRGLYGWFGVNWKRPGATLQPARLETLADPGTAVPALGAEAAFHDFRSAPVTQRYVAFAGGGKGFSGIYYADLRAPGKPLRPVVDNESQLQGLFAGSFRKFAKFCTVFDNSIVFVGYAGKGYAGVFLYNIDAEELFLLADNRTKMGENRIRDFEIAGHFMVGNRFAVTAHFQDNTSGVYMATVPEWSYRRLRAVVLTLPSGSGIVEGGAVTPSPHSLSARNSAKAGTGSGGQQSRR